MYTPLVSLSPCSYSLPFSDGNSQMGSLYISNLVLTYILFQYQVEDFTVFQVAIQQARNFSFSNKHFLHRNSLPF